MTFFISTSDRINFKLNSTLKMIITQSQEVVMFLIKKNVGKAHSKMIIVISNGNEKCNNLLNTVSFRSKKILCYLKEFWTEI